MVQKYDIQIDLQGAKAGRCSRVGQEGAGRKKLRTSVTNLPVSAVRSGLHRKVHHGPSFENLDMQVQGLSESNSTSI